MKKPTAHALRAAALAAALASFAPMALQAQESATGPHPGRGIEAYLSQDALQVSYMRDMGLGKLGTDSVHGGFLLNEGNDFIGVADVSVEVDKPTTSSRRWRLEVGPRAYAALLSLNNQDVFAVAVGGTFSYFLGPKRGTSASATAYYAPDITVFGNADSVTDLDVRFETRLSESTRIFFGYRWFRFDLSAQSGIDAGDRDIDEGAQIGIKYRF